MRCFSSKNKNKNDIVLSPKVTKVFVEVVKTTFTPTGDFEKDKERGKMYAKAVGMDDANTKMAVVMATKGNEAAAKAMIKDCGGDYFAMRAKYG